MFSNDEQRKAAFANMDNNKGVSPDALPEANAGVNNSLLGKLGLKLNMGNMHPDYMYPSRDEINKALEKLPKELIEKLKIEGIAIDEIVTTPNNITSRVSVGAKTLPSMGGNDNQVMIQPIPKAMYEQLRESGKGYELVIVRAMGRKFFDRNIKNTPLENAWNRANYGNGSISSVEPGDAFADSFANMHCNGNVGKNQKEFISKVERIITEGEI